MTFTDEDLKRIKLLDHGAATMIGSDDLRALIARLEAAEKAVESIAKWERYSCLRSDLDRDLGAKAHGEYVSAVRAWRRAAGK